MRKKRVCLDCGAPEAATYISTRLICRNCAKVRAAVQVDQAYDLAEGLGPRTDPTLAGGIARSSAIIQANYVNGQVRKAARAKQRAKVKAAVKR